MKTDKKTMAEIWREIENNPDAEIETHAEFIGWVRFTGFVFNPEKYSYRIKPKTITVNGVEIPKPLSRCEFSDGDTVFLIGDIDDLYFEVIGLYVTNNGGRFIYKTKEEAIEASKKLFGIE